MVISYLGKSFVLVISFIFFFNESKSQVLNGVVYDKTSKQKVTNAIIKVGDRISLTNNRGYFAINSFSKNDTLKIRALGYKSFQEVLKNFSLQDTIKLFLIQDPYELKEVSITARRDELKDSINFRNDYLSAFNYKYQPLKDFVVKRNFFSKVPTFKGQSSNYIAVLNLLPLLNLVNSKKEPVSKLQQTLFKEEDLDYVDRRFSKQFVQQQTGLAGDSLFLFMHKYKLDAAKLKGMSNYQLNVFIKDSFKEFIKDKLRTRKIN
jgi:hypothetical protein